MSKHQQGPKMQHHFEELSYAAYAFTVGFAAAAILVLVAAGVF
jgi:hypothetical protein